jgi:hypothetical protein
MDGELGRAVNRAERGDVPSQFIYGNGSSVIFSIG